MIVLRAFPLASRLLPLASLLARLARRIVDRAELRFVCARCCGHRRRCRGEPAVGRHCVELARLTGGEYAVRNSRNPDGPALIYTRAEIAALIEGVKRGEFDDLLV